MVILFCGLIYPKILFHRKYNNSGKNRNKNKDNKNKKGKKSSYHLYYGFQSFIQEYVQIKQVLNYLAYFNTIIKNIENKHLWCQYNLDLPNSCQFLLDAAQQALSLKECKSKGKINIAINTTSSSGEASKQRIPQSAIAKRLLEALLNSNRVDNNSGLINIYNEKEKIERCEILTERMVQLIHVNKEINAKN